MRAVSIKIHNFRTYVDAELNLLPCSLSLFSAEARDRYDVSLDRAWHVEG
jgi:hypothetical protein